MKCARKANVISTMDPRGSACKSPGGWRAPSTGANDEIRVRATESCDYGSGCEPSVPPPREAAKFLRSRLVATATKNAT